MKPDGHTEYTTNRDQMDMPETENALAPLPFEFEKYEPYIRDLDVTDEQARELLEALFNIMSAFVDMGFGLDSTQSILGSMIEKVAEDSENPLQPIDNADTFNGVAEGRDNE